MQRDPDDPETLTEVMAASILQKVGSNTADTFAGMDRLHVMCAVLARCEDTGGRPPGT